MPLALVNRRTDQRVADSVELALTIKDRRRGLLGRPALESGAAMYLSPCLGVHTMRMLFAIDVVFVDAAGCAVRIVHALQPWRIAVSLRARSVIELPAGRLRTCAVELGDRLQLVAVDGKAC